jgi:hypothetical protein
MGWYFKAQNRGINPATDPSFPYRREVVAIVASQTFQAILDAEDWPSGDSGVSPSFVVDARQPAEALQRFGSSGALLSGEGIHDDSDGVRYVEVALDIKLPQGLARRCS